MKRRITTALIAATATALVSVSPALAQSSTQNAPADTETTTDNSGSTFMGPRELSASVVGGYGSSGVPDDGTGTDQPGEEPINPEDYPEWMRSSIAPSPEVEIAFAVLQAIVAVGAAATQAAVVLAPIVGVDTYRDWLRQVGINV